MGSKNDLKTVEMVLSENKNKLLIRIAVSRLSVPTKKNS